MARRKRKVTELSRGRPRKEEERFFLQFSETQMTAVMLFVLADTFFVQGVVRYLELTKGIMFIKTWLILIVLSLFFFVSSVVSITVGGVVCPLNIKRKINLISFGTFLAGVILFLTSLFFLLLLL